MPRSLHGNRARILIADTNMTFRETLAQHLRASGFEVVTASNGQSAFSRLRDRDRPIDWFYVRADLQDLMDGWILADEYHDSHPHQAAVIAASVERVSGQGHVVLKDPPLAVVVDAIQTVSNTPEGARSAAVTDSDPRRRAA
ncbi:response regulator [Microvirga sp. HBU67558]|uniref:response regulator n=1 Tax=Microvirga TaxID=186650 RepID=UPI001B36184A|nr:MULTISPECIES: response regulator [unclassified Microvirga]MBQ0822601.1 response regulator [Microvirga sp. HBU67558]